MRFPKLMKKKRINQTVLIKISYKIKKICLFFVVKTEKISENNAEETKEEQKPKKKVAVKVKTK